MSLLVCSRRSWLSWVFQSLRTPYLFPTSEPSNVTSAKNFPNKQKLETKQNDLGQPGKCHFPTTSANNKQQRHLFTGGFYGQTVLWHLVDHLCHHLFKHRVKHVHDVPSAARLAGFVAKLQLCGFGSGAKRFPRDSLDTWPCGGSKSKPGALVKTQKALLKDYYRWRPPPKRYLKSVLTRNHIMTEHVFVYVSNGRQENDLLSVASVHIILRFYIH